MGSIGHMFISKCSENASLAKNILNYKSEGGGLMLTNGGHLYFNHMGDLILLAITFHINEYSMANILSFVEVSNNAGVYINVDTPKEKSINVHIKDGKLFISKHVRSVFLTQTLMTQK